MAAVMWWPLAAWLSPATAWFIFFNAVVAAIAVMSSDAHRADGGEARTPAAPRRGLCRSGSSSVVLDRLRSFSIFAVHPAAAPTGGDDATAGASESSQFYCYGTREAEEAEAEAAAARQTRARGQPHRIQKQAVAAPAPLAAATTATATSSAVPPPSAPVAMAQAEEDHAAAPVAPAPENDEDHDKAEPEAEEQEESISLDEAYALALARRLRAQELASPPSPTPALATATATARTKKPTNKVAAAEGVTRRRAKAGEALEGKAELNARAELFIRQFREELKLQRLNSILSHTHALRSPTPTAAR